MSNKTLHHNDVVRIPVCTSVDFRLPNSQGLHSGAPDPIQSIKPMGFYASLPISIDFSPLEPAQLRRIIFSLMYPDGTTLNDAINDTPLPLWILDILSILEGNLSGSIQWALQPNTQSLGFFVNVDYELEYDTPISKKQAYRLIAQLLYRSQAQFTRETTAVIIPNWCQLAILRQDPDGVINYVSQFLSNEEPMPFETDSIIESVSKRPLAKTPPPPDWNILFSSDDGPSDNLTDDLTIPELELIRLNRLSLMATEFFSGIQKYLPIEIKNGKQGFCAITDYFTTYLGETAGDAVVYLRHLINSMSLPGAYVDLAECNVEEYSESGKDVLNDIRENTGKYLRCEV